MDQYIKRKKKNVEDLKNAKNEPVVKQKQQQIYLRQTNNQLKLIVCEIDYLQKRLLTARQTIQKLEVRLNGSNIAHKKLLGNSLMQKSQLKNQIPNREPLKTNAIVQQAQKLGRTQVMAETRNVSECGQQNINITNEKLQQLSKGIGRTRKIKKRS